MKFAEKEREYLLEILEEKIIEHAELREFDDLKVCRNIISKLTFHNPLLEHGIKNVKKMQADSEK